MSTRLADRLIALLEMRRGDHVADDNGVDKYTHMLQTATRAERAGEPPDYVVMALFHDVFGQFSATKHAEFAAETLRPFISEGGYHDCLHHAWAMNRLRKGAAATLGSGFGSGADRFASKYDLPSFDPTYDTLPLEHFLPTVREVLKCSQ